MTAIINKVLVCNILEGNKVCAAGALAFVEFTNPGNGSNRIQVWVRSRGGRHVLRYEPIYNLTNFRFKTIPKESPLNSHDTVQACIMLGNHLYSINIPQDKAFQEVADKAREERKNKSL